MGRTITWKPRQIHWEDAAKHGTTNGHSNVSTGRGGLAASSISAHCGGTQEIRKQNAKAPEPDGRLSWMIAALCFLVNMMSTSYFRCAGLFFSASMSTFGVSRAEASLPLSVYTGFKFLSGLFSGVLIQFCGARRAATIGTSLLTAGLSVSFFAKGVSFLAVSAGFLAGTGHGIIMNSCVVRVSQYFDRRRGAALGLSMAGATIASLIFPKVYEHLLAEYGLRGALLIIGASMGNLVPITFLMREPPWKALQSEERITAKEVTDSARSSCDIGKISGTDGSRDKAYMGKEQIPPATMQTGKPTMGGEVNYKSICRRGTVFSLTETSSVTYIKRPTIISTPYAEKMPRRSTISFGQLSAMSRRGISSSSTETRPPPPDATRNLDQLRTRRATMFSVAGSLYASNQLRTRHERRQSRGTTVVHTSNAALLHAATREATGLPTIEDETPSSTSVLQNILQVLKNPRFYFHALSYVSRSFFLDCFLTVVFDFAQDAGVARADSVHALSFFAVADAMGRLFVPYLSDYGLISNCGLLTINYFTLCLLQYATPYVAGRYDVWALSGAFGLPTGYIMVGASQILSTEIGPKNLPIALGLMTTAAATGSFVRPVLIGFFRDKYGSYKGLFHLISGMLAVSFLCTLGLWISGRFKERKVADVNLHSYVTSAEPIATIKEENFYVSTNERNGANGEMAK